MQKFKPIHFSKTPTPPSGIGESLQDYAARTNRTLAEAYPAWHAHGAALAKVWQRPVASNVHPAIELERPYIVIASGRAIGLLPADVEQLER